MSILGFGQSLIPKDSQKLVCFFGILDLTCGKDEDITMRRMNYIH